MRLLLSFLIAIATVTIGTPCAVEAQSSPGATTASATWQHIPMPPTAAPDGVRQIYFTPTGEMYVSFDKAGIWRSRDLGRTWQDIHYNIPSPINGGQFCLTREGDMLYATGSGAVRGIYRLPPGKDLWEAATVEWKGLSGSDIIGRMVVNKAGDVIAASGGCQVLRSTDGGRTFVHTGNRLAGAALFDLKVSPVDQNELAIGNEIGPAWRSTDGGLTWTDIGKPGGNCRLAYNRLGQLFGSATHDAAGKGWLLARWTDGRTWVQSDEGLPPYEDTRCSALAENGWMIVGNTSVYISKDDGNTWMLAAPGFPAAGGRQMHVRCLALGTDGCLYAGVMSPDPNDLGIWRVAMIAANAPSATQR